MHHPLTLGEVVDALDRLYPPTTAMSWDRVGLVSGRPSALVSRIHFAVDPAQDVVDEALAAGADLLVTHHPLLLRGVSSVATTSAKGEVVTSLVEGGLALFTAHTNADIAVPGVSDALAAAVGLTPAATTALEPGGVGRVGDLDRPVTLSELAERLAAALPPAPVGIRVSGDGAATVRRVAVVGGAGDDLFDAVRASRADVYVTADLRHHPALEAREEARHGGDGTPYLIDAGHWASEWLWLPSARERVIAALGERAARLVTHISDLRTDPWDFVVGGQR